MGDQLYDMMCMALGGRAAEQIFYDRVSTGAADDLNKVMKIAYGQISVYGMNDKLGLLSFPPGDSGQNFTKPYSEKTAELIDEEAMILVKKAYVDTIDLLTKYKDQVSAVAAALLEKETIGHEDIVEVLGERPFQNDAYKAYIQNTKDWDEKYQQDVDEQKKKDEEEEEATKVDEAEVVVEEEEAERNQKQRNNEANV